MYFLRVENASFLFMTYFRKMIKRYKSINITTSSDIEDVNILDNDQVDGFYAIDGLRLIKPQKVFKYY